MKRRITGGAGARSRPSGFTLVEVVIAALLLMVALVGIVPFFVSALGQSSAVRYRSSASNIASERMEQIRQLDFREITDAEYLASVFGDTMSLRGIDFNVHYAVDTSAYGEGVLKQITVTVDWEAPPKVVAVSLTSMFHQQFVGPRISWLEVSPVEEDALGTPFPVLKVDFPHLIKVHIAEADWGLVIDNLNEPGMAVSDAYFRMNLVDENGITLSLGDPEDDYVLGGLDYAVDGEGEVYDVFFPLTLDSTNLPDGYWELQAVAFNEYDEPGNLWRLRVRVENAPPAAPTGFLGEVQYGNEGICLYWSGGAERDRKYYLIQRSTWDPLYSVWGAWEDMLEDGSIYIDPGSTSYLDDGGSIGLQVDPWGDETTTNYYKYKILAVDLADNPGDPAECEVSIPPAEPVTTTSTLETTSISTTSTAMPTSFNVLAVNTINKEWSVTLECVDPMQYDYFPVARMETYTMDNLPPGQYQISASTPGRDTREASFTLDGPEDEGMIVLTLL